MSRFFFRDAKGNRFGEKIKWTGFKTAGRLERMYSLLGVAILLWTAVGAEVREKNRRVWLRLRTKGVRISLAINELMGNLIRMTEFE